MSQNSLFILKPEISLERARNVLQTEADAILEVCAHLDKSFHAAVACILNCQGRIVVSGMGKSGHIANKIAATLASTGTPAFFVHPAEASHGDLGMITHNDIFLALSYSGETQELLTIIPLIKRMGAKLIACTGHSTSNLAQLADIHLNVRISKEACPLNLAPTASTTATLALGDALAVVLLEARGFGKEDFARSHPGGHLGRRLLTHVSDVMRTGNSIPKIQHTALLPQALLEITAKRMGMTVVLDDMQQLIGIFTDGDLRRAIEQGQDIRHIRVREVMTPNPRTIGPNHLAEEAVALMEQFKINQLLVLDQGKLVGALNMHDLFAAKVI